MIEYAEVIVLAQTIYGEAEGENFLTKLAIGQIIKNRVERQWRGAKTYQEVCWAPRQFSCWNEGSPRLRAMLKPQGQAWNESLRAAFAVLQGLHGDEKLKNVYHYTDTSIGRPIWAEDMELIKIPEIPKINFWR